MPPAQYLVDTSTRWEAHPYAGGEVFGLLKLEHAPRCNSLFVCLHTTERFLYDDELPNDFVQFAGSSLML